MDTKDNSDQSNYLSCGYKVSNIQNFEDKHYCIYCRYIIREPVQLLECGHRSCKGCHESRSLGTTSDTMKCPVEDCNTEFSKNQVMSDRAFKRELDIMQVACVHAGAGGCSWRGQLKTYQEHLDLEHVHHTCLYCKETFLSVQVLNNHIDTSCKELFETCPLAPYCGETLIRKAEIGSHLLSEFHQAAIVDLLTGKTTAPDQDNQNEKMETDAATEELEKQVSEKLSELADKVQKLSDDTLSLNQDFIKLTELQNIASHELDYFKTEIRERNIVIGSVYPQQEEIQGKIETLRKNFEMNENISYDGTLTWRIDHVADKISDAQSERQPSIYSPIFYSSSHGYKMRARLYLFGDGSGRRTHISLFFMLMKGEYDALLTWPFAHKVTFCLFDQTGNNRHIIDSFRPDTKSSSFKRPEAEANIASGIPKFFPLPMIQQDDSPYVKDDTMFIKILVDLTEIPKSVLPFMLTLNPGLPTHVQHYKLDQEKKKQQQTNNSTNISTSSANCS